MKPGRVVIVLQGRQAGKKAVIVKNHDKGDGNRKFPHALIAGVERAPLKVTTRMSKKKLARRSRVKPFVKAVNFNHLLPTRYTVDFQIDINKEDLKETKKNVRQEFETKYVSGAKESSQAANVGFFFKKLRF